MGQRSLAPVKSPRVIPGARFPLPAPIVRQRGIFLSPRPTPYHDSSTANISCLSDVNFQISTGISISDFRISFSVSQTTKTAIRSSELHSLFGPFSTLADRVVALLAKSKIASSRLFNAFYKHFFGPHVLVTLISLCPSPPSIRTISRPLSSSSPARNWISGGGP